MTAIIRRAEPGDAERLIEMINALSAFVQDPPTQLTAEDIRRDGFGPEAWFDCFLAEVEGKAVGYALTYFGFTIDHGGRGLHLADLYVDAEQRGRGLGRALMAAAARHGLDHGARWMLWDVWVENAPAKTFYATLGAACCDDVEPLVLKGPALTELAQGAR